MDAFFKGIAEMNQMMIFGSIAGIGGVFFILSMLLGGDTDDGSDITDDTDIGEGGDPSPPVFSVRNVMLLMLGFGSGGAIATYYNASAMVASLTGLATGLVFAAIGWYAFVLLYKQQGSAVMSASHIPGATARVVGAIVTHGRGEISFTDPHRGLVYLTAQSADGEAIDAGTVVRIVEVNGTVAVVEKTA